MHSFTRSLQVFVDGKEIAQGCHLFLSSRETLSLQPALFHLEIHNLSESSVALLESASVVEVQSKGSILASGQIIEAFTRRENSHLLTSVSFSPSYSFWSASVSLTLAAGISTSSAIRSILASATPVISLAAFSAPDRTFSRPLSFFGRASDAISLLAESVDADACLTSAGVCVISRSLSSTALSLILPSSALLSEPIPVSDHVLLTTTMTGWPMGSTIQYTWNDTTRTGRLVSRTIQADNVSGPWRSVLELAL